MVTALSVQEPVTAYRVGINGPGPSHLERVTGIEPALSAWESVQSGFLCCLTCGAGHP